MVLFLGIRSSKGISVQQLHRAKIRRTDQRKPYWSKKTAVGLLEECDIGQVDAIGEP